MSAHFTKIPSHPSAGEKSSFQVFHINKTTQITLSKYFLILKHAPLSHDTYEELLGNVVAAVDAVDDFEPFCGPTSPSSVE